MIKYQMICDFCYRPLSSDGRDYMGDKYDYVVCYGCVPLDRDTTNFLMLDLLVLDLEDDSDE